MLVYLRWVKISFTIHILEGLSLRLLTRLAEKLDTPAVIFCGDFNATPDFPPYEFLKNGSLSEATIEKLNNRKIEDLEKMVFISFSKIYPSFHATSCYW